MVLKFITKQGSKPITIVQEITAVFGDHTFSKKITVEAIIPENIKKSKIVIRVDTRLKKKTIGKNLNFEFPFSMEQFYSSIWSSWYAKGECEMGAENVHTTSKKLSFDTIKHFFISLPLPSDCATYWPPLCSKIEWKESLLYVHYVNMGPLDW